MAEQTIEKVVKSLKKQSERHVTSWLKKRNSDAIRKQHKEESKNTNSCGKSQGEAQSKKVLLLRHPMMCLQTELSKKLFLEYGRARMGLIVLARVWEHTRHFSLRVRNKLWSRKTAFRRTALPVTFAAHPNRKIQNKNTLEADRLKNKTFLRLFATKAMLLNRKSFPVSSTHVWTSLS